MGKHHLSSSLLVLLVTEFCFHGHSATYWKDVEVLKQFRNGVDSNSVSPGSCLSTWDFSVDPCDNLSGEKFTCGLRCDVVYSNTARVTDLSLDRAGYSGSLTSTSWNLPYLQTLELSGNFFSGQIPDSFSNLTRLQRLGLSSNSLSGEIPTTLGNSLSNLEELYLDTNNLQGTIPLSLNGLHNLKRLELQGNKLTGAFPDLSQLSNVYFLYASDNAISGQLPANLPTSLVELSMRNNQLKGNIPASLVNSVYLQVLDLSHNKLSGSVPSGLFTHPSLQQLTLSYNHFRWVQVPANWGKNSELIAVDVSNNELRGLLPEFLGWMPRLSALMMENNKFSGMIPTQYALKAVVPAGEGVVAPFERLLLRGNYLFGLVPGPLLQLKPGSATVWLGDNCLYQCPVSFFFCQGGQQKTLKECKTFSPVIP